MPQPGTVYLVGSGPGDPGLITVRGLECLRQADLVLYDGLVNPLLLLHTSADTERTCRVRSPAGHTLNQEEINNRLIAAARSGRTVVRLKGGDPFIFGRGSEEAAALRAAGIAYEVIPGITAATAAGAYTEIPLTHRKHASAVAFVTGHEDPDKSHTAVDYGQLAQFPGTLVFYMGLHRLDRIVEALVSNGQDPQTPAAVISRATTSAQETVSSTLSEIVGAVRSAKLRPPSLIVVGPCALRHDRVSWFEQRPLIGLRIGIPRAIGQAAPTVERVVGRGGQPVLMPTIEIAPVADWTGVDQSIRDLPSTDWLVFTSSNGVDHYLSRIRSMGLDARQLSNVRIATIGPSTAQALERYGLSSDLTPDAHRAESLAESLVPHVSGRRVIWPKADRGREVLAPALTAAGAHVEQVVVYHNQDVVDWPEDVQHLLDRGELDWIGLSSPSIARGVQRLMKPETREQLGRTLHLASISPVTTAAATDAGLVVSAEARDFTWDGILDAIEEFQASDCRPTPQST
ncbi:MAG: uroporphyrinogen-III C-methyltransferase [Planctomycetaceae bacterium]